MNKFILCILVCFYAATCSLSAQNPSVEKDIFAPPVPPVPGTPEWQKRQKQINSAYEELKESQRNLSPEELPVYYVLSNKDETVLKPAYVREMAGEIFLWKDVALGREKIPIKERAMQAFPIFELYKYPLVKAYEVSPPIFYTPLDSGKFGEGYYDKTNHVFYRLNDVELDESQIPEEAKLKGRLVKASKFEIARITLQSDRPKLENKNGKEAVDTGVVENHSVQTLTQPEPTLSPVATPVVSTLPEEKSSSRLLIVVGMVLVTLAGSGLFWLLKKPSSS